jgi:NAD(P)-dependent dehydrogenase (short-subunit alcohol dehydrogenase family)
VSDVAVVTGAASGIGRATAIWLARDGYQVAMLDLDTAGLTETRAQIDRIGGKARQFPVDLRDPLAVGSVTREIAVTIGAPQVLVNVAGIGVAATVLETSDDDWSRVLAVNLTGPFLTTRATLPLMLDRGSGVIVNIASVGGLVGLARRAAYCASKAGLIGLTKAIAVDHAREGIRCVAICPGTVETEAGTPDEIAAMVSFVAGPEGRFINGTALVIDGGMTAA